jgi:hypothetical protein
MHGFLVGPQTSRDMMRARGRLLLASLSLAILAGCSSGQLINNLPASVALPADAPARPATPYAYPAVHDMPPPRATEPMSAEDQLRLEKELTALRNRQEGLKPEDEKTLQTRKKNAKKATKKSAEDAQNGAAAGAKANP